MEGLYKVSSQYLQIAASHSGSPLTSDVQPMCRAAYLEEKQANRDRVPLDYVLKVWQRLSSQSGDPLFGLRMGMDVRFADYGLFSHLLMHCPTLLEALQLIHDYRYLMNEAFESELSVNDNVVVYTLDMDVDSPGVEHLLDFHFASFLSLGRQLISPADREKLRPLHLELQRDAGDSGHLYCQHFGCDVEFGCRSNKIIFDRELLQLSSHAPNEGLYRYLYKQVETLYQSTYSQHSISKKLVNLLMASYEQEDSALSMESLASKLGLSVSTLKRKLRSEGSSYQELVDQVRFRKAKQLMLKNKSPLTEVAYTMGFSSMSAFSRSFKRWSGLSPSQYLESR